MGKKSRRNRNTSQSNTITTPQSFSQIPAPPSSVVEPIYYPSDGPSDVELLQTSSGSLQAKLNHLTHLGLVENDRASFVEEFVPLDLSPGDKAGYLADLTTAPEAEGQWNNLIAEIAAIRSGKGVDRIEGDQVTRAVFFFEHPLLEKCDREVSFVCVGGEWRAEG
eukprot:CAMPEP_0178926398 /NCGR_PEP_ID=MMETSP0786-20121207/18511_1 /TAXON_ID=186022 /ORGANISM="Thalassionema frauenfeldii, Strain CCMP 1798" /LENGTH=164 /DNA_ID=CAMNT_0020601517 /DNA_START=23 /DNA_END=517 /DNA_ORIENTATION=+